MTNALSNLTSLPSSKVNRTDLAKRYAASSFLKRAQVVSSGKLVNEKGIKPGNWAIPVSDDEVTDLGNSIDVLVIAVRDKALDTNEKPPVAAYDPEGDLYKQIEERAAEKNSGCMYGPSFLVYERSSGQFLEIFFGNASGRQEAGNLADFLPVSEADAKALGPKFKAQGPQAATLSTKYIKRPKFSWWAPVVGKCSTPFKELPETEEFVKQATKFINQKDEGPEVDEKADEGRSR